MSQLGSKFLVYFATAKLRRFRRNEYQLERFLRIGIEKITKLLPHLFSIHVANNDEGEIIRHVPGFVILHHLFLRKLVVNLQFAYDRKPVRVPLIRRRKEIYNQLTQE